MEGLKYFKDVTVPCVMTHGVHERLTDEMVKVLFTLGFMRGKEETNNFNATAYFQVFDIKTKKNTMYVKMSQEQPDIITEYKVELKTAAKKFNGRIYLIETWNGKTENVTIDDHYITLLLPSEY